MLVLITGGAGFIGSHVARRLAERGDELEQLDVAFRRWNAQLDEEGRVVPQFARV